MVVKHYQIAEDHMNNLPFEEGSLYITTDTGRLYYDVIGGYERALISADPIILSTEQDRESLLSPISGKLYVVLDGYSIYIYYNEKWNKIGSTQTQNTISYTDILQVVYPVGAIYMSINNTSPASLFGGSWEQIEDVFLLGAGSAYTAGSTGGESTHTLTVQEMPVHSHTVNAHSHAIGLDNDTTVGTYGWSLHINSNGTSVTGAHKTVTSGTSSPNTNTIGGGVAHNNMPPYLTVYMWKRIE